MMERWVERWGMGTMEGGHAGEGAGVHKGTRARVGARFASRYPTIAMTMTSIWTLNTLPWMCRMKPRWHLYEHQQPHCCHPHLIPTLVPTAHPRPKIPLSFVYPPIVDIGDYNCQPYFLSWCRYLHWRQRWPQIPIPATSCTCIDHMTTIKLTLSFSILLNPMVTTIFPCKLPVMLYSTVDPYLALYLIPHLYHYHQLVAWALSIHGYHAATLHNPTWWCQWSPLLSTASLPPYPHFWVLLSCAALISALFAHSDEEGSSGGIHAYLHLLLHTPHLLLATPHI